MTHYDIIKINSSLIALLVNARVSIADVKYLSMYEEYRKMADESQKKQYIFAYLADKYNMTPRGVTKILHRLQLKIEI